MKSKEIDGNHYFLISLRAVGGSRPWSSSLARKSTDANHAQFLQRVYWNDHLSLAIILATVFQTLLSVRLGVLQVPDDYVSILITSSIVCKDCENVEVTLVFDLNVSPRS